MKKIVTIGSIDVEMYASAACFGLYEDVFHEDFLAQGSNPAPNSVSKMGFIFAAHAKNSLLDVSKMSKVNYYEWLDQFEPLDVMLAAEEISELIAAQSETKSIPKNVGA